MAMIRASMQSGSRRDAPLWLVLVVLGTALIAVAGHAVPRAAFKPDDYRYLWQLREMQSEGWGAFLRAMVVENRWDDAWWLPDGTLVRFLRPFVIASFGFDRWLFGESASGFIASNLAWHLVSGLALLRCLERLQLPTLAVWTGALVHTVGAARYEHIVYVAGRTDTFAAIAFFGAFALYLGKPQRSAGCAEALRGSALTVSLAYAAALLAKEYAALLPLLFLGADRWCSGATAPAWKDLIWGRRRHYAGCLIVLALYLALRQSALHHPAFGDGTAGAHPYPYFFLPPRPGALEHAFAAWLQYGVYLVPGGIGPAFLSDLEELWKSAGATAVIAAGLGVPALLIWGFLRGSTARFLAWAFVLTLVPLLGLYTTGRYLALASLGWSGLAGCAVAATYGKQRLLGAVLLAGAIGPSAWGLHQTIARLPKKPTPSESQVLVELVRASSIPSSTRPLVLVDSSLHWLHRQFLPHMLAIEGGVYPDEPLRQLPRIWTLTQVAPGGAVPPTHVQRWNEREIELSRAGHPLVFPHPWGDFDSQGFAPGDRVQRDGYEVEVLEALEGRPTRIRVRFGESVDLRALRGSPEGPRLVPI